MKRTDAQQVGDIINHFLKEEHLEGKFDEQRALTLWGEIVGPAINRYTVRRHVSGGVMHITLSSAPLRNEMMLTRSSLIEKINKAIGRDVIQEIVFH